MPDESWSCSTCIHRYTDEESEPCKSCMGDTDIYGDDHAHEEGSALGEPRSAEKFWEAEAEVAKLRDDLAERDKRVEEIESDRDRWKASSESWGREVEAMCDAEDAKVEGLEAELRSLKSEIHDYAGDDCCDYIGPADHFHVCEDGCPRCDIVRLCVDDDDLTVVIEYGGD